MKRYIGAVLLVILLVASACGGDDENTASISGSAENVGATADPPSEGSVGGHSAELSISSIPAMPFPATVPPQGANAAPRPTVAVTTPRGIDMSQKAFNLLYAWWRYEIQASQDAFLTYDDLDSAATSTCSQLTLGKTPKTVEKNIASQYGLTLGGGSAVAKSAIKSLCTKNDRGYKTYFDQNVAKFILLAKQDIGFRATFYEYDFGVFMKEACLSIGRDGTTGFYQHMYEPPVRGLNLAINIITERERRILLRTAVMAGCSTYITRLPPVVINQE